jgi:hypothetical protein
MTFTEFVNTAAQKLKPLQAQLVERHESESKGAVWWVAFRKAGSLYRVRFDGRAASLTLEREQGSFVPNSPSTWRLLETRQPDDLSFEKALEVLDEMLERFKAPGH